MLRSLVVLLLAFAPLIAPAEPLANMGSRPTSRAAEAIRLGVERQVQRSGGTIRQSDRGDEAALSQSGTDNQGIIVQRGSGHAAFLMQTGTGNASAIIQLGRGVSSVVVQSGNETGATVQIGRSHR